MCVCVSVCVCVIYPLLQVSWLSRLTSQHSPICCGSPNDYMLFIRLICFQHINWEDLLQRRVVPPFKPTVRHMEDVSNFDEEFTAEKPILTPPKDHRPLKDLQQYMFKDFTYMADWC